MRRLPVMLVFVACAHSGAAETSPTATATATATETETAKSPALAASLRDAGSELWPPEADSERRRSELGASPPTPAYDLAADRARILELARAELAPSVQAVTVQDAFVLIGAPGWNAAALASSTSLATQAIDAYFHGRFDKRPDRAIGVYLFATGDTYQAYCRAHLGGACPSVFGVYHPDVRRIVMNAGPGLGTLTHELVHPIVEADFPTAPIWINEGLASLFEAPVIPRAGEIHGAKNWRLPRLITGFGTPAEKDSAKVEALFGMSDAIFRDDLEKLHYATARYLCQWLDGKGVLWSFYRAWRDHVADDPTGEKAFTQVVGMTPAQANLPWSAWVKGL